MQKLTGGRRKRSLALALFFLSFAFEVSQRRLPDPVERAGLFDSLVLLIGDLFALCRADIQRSINLLTDVFLHPCKIRIQRIEVSAIGAKAQ